MEITRETRKVLDLSLDLELLHGDLSNGKLYLTLLRSRNLTVVDDLKLLEILVFELLSLRFELLLGDLTNRDEVCLKVANLLVHVLLLLIELGNSEFQTLNLLEMFTLAATTSFKLELNVLEYGVEAVLGRDKTVLGKVLKVGNDLVYLISELLVTMLTAVEFHPDKDLKEGIA